MMEVKHTGQEGRNVGTIRTERKRRMEDEGGPMKNMAKGGGGGDILYFDIGIGDTIDWN